jgi:hypothetical protein
MLLTVVPTSALSIFPAANTQLAAVTLPKYRELLRKLKANGSVEESSSAFQQAKQRVLLRLQQRRCGTEVLHVCMWQDLHVVTGSRAYACLGGRLGSRVVAIGLWLYYRDAIASQAGFVRSSLHHS